MHSICKEMGIRRTADLRVASEYVFLTTVSNLLVSLLEIKSDAVKSKTA